MDDVFGVLQLIHSQQHKVVKCGEVNYLNSLPESTTAKSIAGLTLTSANYEQA